MIDTRIEVHAGDAVAAADLAEWLTAKGVTTAIGHDPSIMGTAETISMIVSGAAGLRGGFMVLREWIRARRTTVTVKTPGGLEYEITSSTDDESLVELIRQIRGETRDQGRDDD